MTEFLESIAFYRQHGILPEAGGLNDQPAVWTEACLIAVEQIDDRPKQE